MTGHSGIAEGAEPVELVESWKDVSDPPAHDNESRQSVVSQNDLTPLLDQQSARDVSSAPQQTPASTDRTRLAVGIDNTLRLLGLHAITSASLIFFYSRKRERKRVAIIANRPAVVLASVLHVLPVGACVVLIGLTRNGYYIGGELSGAVGEDQLKFLGLQLAAKLHEITMVASLAEMVFYSIRREIKAGRSIPFAALTAGMQFDSISYLWSKDFFAICLHAFRQNWWTLRIAALVVVCSILGVTVAPASATAMQPVLNFWPAGGTDVWLNGSTESLYPATLDASHVASAECDVVGRNSLCPSVGWETLGTNMLSYFPQLQSSPDGLGVRYPDTLQVAARSATLQIYLDVRQPVFDRYNYNYTVSTAQHAVMAEALAQNTRLWDLASRNSTAHGETRFFYRQEAKYIMSANNALVHVRCHDNGAITAESRPAPLFPDFGSESYEPVSIINNAWMEWIVVNAAAQAANILWVDLPPTEVRRTSLGAIAMIPDSALDGEMRLWGCSIDARWANTEITSSGIRRGTEGQPWSFHINGSPLSSWLWQDYFPRITIGSTYAQYLNPRSSDNSSTVFSQLCVVAGLCGQDHLQTVVEPAPALEATLNLMVINGLVRLAPTVSVQGMIADWDDGRGPWWRRFMPSKRESLGWGGNAYNVTDAQVTELFRAQMRVTAKGYAYVWNGSAIKASMTILAVYVAIAVLHVCFSIGTGVTSSSWDTPSEVIALAANSPPPRGNLQNTGAGISKITTLSQNVCIEATGSVLQLSFGAERVISDRVVKANTLYG